MTPEKRVQDAILTYLSKLKSQGQPIYFERRQAGGFSYKMGQADLYFVFNGRHIEIEVKAPGKSLRPMQVKWATMCKSIGIDCLCIDDVNDLKKYIEDHFLNQK